MLKIFKNIQEFSYSKWMLVYTQSNKRYGMERYLQLSAPEQVLQAENDLYMYLKEMFQTDPKAVCAAWEVQGEYKAALRLETYRDGMLLNSLETAPNARKMGYASSLVMALLEQYSNVPIYSHVHKKNLASIAVHEKCGFYKLSDRAVLLDGSVVLDNVTYCSVN